VGEVIWEMRAKESRKTGERDFFEFLVSWIP
jgi:hypothetical protein